MRVPLSLNSAPELGLCFHFLLSQEFFSDYAWEHSHEIPRFQIMSEENPKSMPLKDKYSGIKSIMDNKEGTLRMKRKIIVILP